VSAGRAGQVFVHPLACVCVCETYIGKPFGTHVVPQFTTEVACTLLSMFLVVWHAYGMALGAGARGLTVCGLASMV
jgi:hypothetical protein